MKTHDSYHRAPRLESTLNFLLVAVFVGVVGWGAFGSALTSLATA